MHLSLDIKIDKCMFRHIDLKKRHFKEAPPVVPGIASEAKGVEWDSHNLGFSSKEEMRSGCSRQVHSFPRRRDGYGNNSEAVPSIVSTDTVSRKGEMEHSNIRSNPILQI